MTGAMKEMVQPTAWENQSDKAVPNARRKIRILAVCERTDIVELDAALVGIGKNAADANIQCAQCIEEPAVARIDHRGHLRTDF